MTDPEHHAVCLFDGRVAVVPSDRPEIDLANPGAFWVVYTGQPEQPAGQATPDQLATEADALPILERLRAVPEWGVRGGRVALAVG